MGASFSPLDQRVTLPALRHEVQTLSRLGVPSTTTRTRWTFGSQRRLVFFFDQGTLWPNPGLLPHTSHTAATGARSQITSKPVSCPMWATGKEYLTSASAANLEVGQRNCQCRRLASSEAPRHLRAGRDRWADSAAYSRQNPPIYLSEHPEVLGTTDTFRTHERAV